MLLRNAADAMANPDGLFSDRADLPPFWQPLVIVGVVIALTMIPSLLLYQRAQAAASGAQQAGLGFVLIVSVIAPPIQILITWALSAGIIHGVSALLGADRGSFLDTLQVVAWGFLPSILTSGLQIYNAWAGVEQIPESATVQEVFAASTSFPLADVIPILAVGVGIWQGIIWTFGTRQVRGLDLRPAAVAAFVPVVLSVALLTVTTLLL